MDRIDCIIVGAGVVGLAVARRLAGRGLDTLILERASAFGTETSSRNSEVIHAGIYYPATSLKAQLCRRGRDLLYAHVADHGVPYRRCGKLIVATAPDQTAVLDKIRVRAEHCGVTDLLLLDAAAAQTMEPALACTAALFSPSTGILDSHAFMLSLLWQAEAAGAILSLNTAFIAAQVTEDGFVLETEDTRTGERFTLAAKHLVNAAGLWASEVAGMISGLAPGHVPTTRFARGTYFSLPGPSAFSRLIYPVPEPGGLGVHLTLDLGDAMRFGPDVDWIEGIDYRVNETQRVHFETEVRKYWPALPGGTLRATYCGIRPKLSGPGEVAADFRIDGPAVHGLPGLINLFGIESPGLTASLAIAETVEATLFASLAAAAVHRRRPDAETNK